MLLTLVIVKASLIDGCEGAIWVITNQPGRGSGARDMCLVVSLLIFCLIFVLFCFFVDGVNAHLHHNLPG